MQSTSPCPINNCGAPVFARGYCGRHWRCNDSYGSPFCLFQGCTADQAKRLDGFCRDHHVRPAKVPRPCVREGCTRERGESRGLCGPHYHHWLRSRGVEDRNFQPRVSTGERFSRSYIVSESGCWEWQSYIGKEGYGKLRVNRHLISAHRYSYEKHVGPIPAGLVIDHLCRVRRCVNPDRLEPVTSAENARRGVEARRNGGMGLTEREAKHHALNVALEVVPGIGRVHAEVIAKAAIAAYIEARTPRPRRSRSTGKVKPHDHR